MNNSPIIPIIEAIYPEDVRTVEAIQQARGYSYLEAYLFRYGWLLVLGMVGVVMVCLFLFGLVYVLAFIGVAVAQVFNFFDTEMPSRMYTFWDWFRYYGAALMILTSIAIYLVWREIKKM